MARGAGRRPRGAWRLLDLGHRPRPVAGAASDHRCRPPPRPADGPRAGRSARPGSARFDGPQGVLLEVGERRFAQTSPEMLAQRRDAAGHDPFVLVLEHLQDPTNFGTLLRSAEAAGVDGVVFPERGAAPLSAAAVKASAGASEHLLLARLPTIGDAIHDLKTAGPAARGRRPGGACIGHGKAARPSDGARRRQRGEQACLAQRSADATCSSASRWPGAWPASTHRRPARCCCSKWFASGPLGGRASRLTRRPLPERRQCLTVRCGGPDTWRTRRMPMYLSRFSYTPGDLGAHGEEPGGPSRCGARRISSPSAGRSMASGMRSASMTAWTLWEAPDNVSMAAVAIAIGGGGRR